MAGNRSLFRGGGKEELLSGFLSEFMRAQFLVEYEECDRKMGLVVTKPDDGNVEPILFTYVILNAEEAPEILSNAINEQKRKFHQLDGATLLGISNAIGCALAIILSEKENVILGKDIINGLCVAVTGEQRFSDKSATGDISKKWFLIGLVIIAVLGFLGFKFLLEHMSLQPVANLSEISWRVIKTDFSNGGFSVEIPFNYQTDSWKKDMGYEFQSGKVFRIYTSKDALFRNHEINVGFLPSYELLDLDIQTDMMLSAMQKKIGEINISSKQHIKVNNKDMIMFNGNMNMKGKNARLTGVVSLVPTGVMWVQIISPEGDNKEHEFFANKIINSIEMQK